MLPLLLITMVFILDVRWGLYKIFILPNSIKLSPTPFPLEEYRLNEPRIPDGTGGI
jgi:hypothetical protein